MDFDLIPIFANSTIYISKSGNFHQVLTYDYTEDSGGYFDKIRYNPDFYQDEVDAITKNQQKFLNEFPNYINDKKVTAKIIHCDIDFKEETLPFFYWVIEFSGKLVKGLNTYHSTIEESVLEYDVNSIYILESPLVLDSIESVFHHEIHNDGRLIKYWGYMGDKVGNTEVLKFKL